mmetsp:Transcript_20721/g.43554  ORF Transcript_20721/g.43554 Transcript_20721/m.43554 type:complete len:242 (+) Transcript_20721:1141-1866(+)
MRPRPLRTRPHLHLSFSRHDRRRRRSRQCLHRRRHRLFVSKSPHDGIRGGHRLLLKPRRFHDIGRSALLVHLHLPHILRCQILFRTRFAILQKRPPRGHVLRMVPHHRRHLPPRRRRIGIDVPTLPPRLRNVDGSPRPPLVRMGLPPGMGAPRLQRRGTRSRGGSVAAVGSEGGVGERIEYYFVFRVVVRGGVCVCLFGGGFVGEGDDWGVVYRYGGDFGFQVRILMEWRMIHGTDGMEWH